MERESANMAVTLSIRIDLPSAGRFGPGKATLLVALDQYGSIAEAARSLDMSYPRALKLVGDMNQQFESPLVESYHGGASRGGAKLTPLGAKVLAIYNDLCDVARRATQTQRKRLLEQTKLN